MDYKNIYNMFISNRKDQPLLKDEYYENHHIIPKCLGGTDNPQNLIKLTAREHFFVHVLLARFAGPKMKIALSWFINSGMRLNRYTKIPPSRVIEKIRKESNLERSKTLTGRIFTEEHKMNISNSKKGKSTWNKGLTIDDDRVKKNVDNMKKTKKNNPTTAWNKGLSGDEYKQHFKSELKIPSMLGRIWINNGIKQRKIMNTDPIPDGWVRGRCDILGNNNPARKQKNEDKTD